MNQFIPFKILAVIYNEETIAQNKSVLLRKRALVSLKECSRLCTVETSFVCESFTYDLKSYDCAWSNVESDIEFVPVHTSNIFISALPSNLNSSSTWYLSKFIAKLFFKLNDD